MRNLLVATLILSGCTSVQLPNIRVCNASPTVSAGAVCGYANSDVTEELSLDQFLDFLEPKFTPPEKGAAVCLSSQDYARLKTAVEQLCKKAGSGCTKETKDNIAQVSARIERLQDKAKAKKPQQLPFPIED